MYGLIFFSARKAPFLKFNIIVPLLVVPSGKINNGGKIPIYSTSSCLTLIKSIVFSFSSLLPPLGMKRLPNAFAIVPTIGAFFKNIPGAKAGTIFLAKMMASNQLT